LSEQVSTTLEKRALVTDLRCIVGQLQIDAVA
jgi:hypothetical protein